MDCRYETNEKDKRYRLWVIFSNCINCKIWNHTCKATRQKNLAEISQIFAQMSSLWSLPFYNPLEICFKEKGGIKGKKAWVWRLISYSAREKQLSFCYLILSKRYGNFALFFISRSQSYIAQLLRYLC